MDQWLEATILEAEKIVRRKSSPVTMNDGSNLGDAITDRPAQGQWRAAILEEARAGSSSNAST